MQQLPPILGLIIGIGGPFFFEFGYLSTVRSGIKSNILVTSTSSPQFDQWANDQIFNASYYIYNLTNYEEVLQGAKANYTLLGPYAYIQSQPLENITFSENGNKATYQMRTLFFEKTEQNRAMGLDPNNDIVININTPFIAALSQADGIDKLFVGLGSGAVFDRYFRWAEQNLVNFTLVKENYDILSQRINQTLSDLVKQGLTPEEAYSAFLNVWTNSTRVPTNYANVTWTNLLISQGKKTPSGISVETATALLNLSDPLSLLNSSLTNWITWGWVINGNTTYNQTVSSHFNLEPRQLELLTKWILTFSKAYTAPHIIAKYNLTQLSDLSYSQYISMAPLDGQSITALTPPIQYIWTDPSTPIEAQVSFDVKQAIYVFETSSLALRNQTNYINFVQYAQTFPSSFSQYNLSTNDAFSLFSNFMSYSQTYSPDYFTEAIRTGGTGLFLRRTVHEWLFECTDTVVEQLQPNPICQYQINNTLMMGPSTIYTGKKNISQIQQYIVWQGKTDLNDIWAQDANITGKSEYGQFNPFLSVNSTVVVWDDNTLRPITFKHDSNFTMDEILTYDFYMTNETFFNSSFYNEPTITGVANMTTFHQGAPIYLGFYGLIGVPDEYTVDKINGLNQNLSDAVTHLQVEPWTGRTLGAHKRLQISSFMSEGERDAWFGGNYPLNYNNVSCDMFYPLIQIELTGSATPQQTKQIRDGLYLALKLRWPLFWAFLGGGVAIFIIGLLTIYCGVQLKKKEGYTLINN